ncbi:YidC/Oxa1 family membrane protein insertase [Alkaliphilus peptidifermentans]|uniref:Protein translocase subunit yidC n=1 Tax=Alkaliphilus peptidifermentans DSM 18978 TaxID=1120976 RepID=A0A1G5HGP3_9FIRM|nr:YidC/Oxa1 family membrane protein insertase [Alkaliphilus peptidifermentans]SCY62897.1 protein translocase subunit yidC [Alkaliphilus peptidifermentans DSM 18978]
MNALAQPLGSLLKIIYDLIGNYGLAIIVFTIVVKLIMVPLTLKQMRSMKQLQEIQPKIKELQEKYKNDKEKLNVKTMELYKEHQVSPFGGCLPLLIQFPVIIGLFAALRNPGLYVFGSEEIYQQINTSFLWLPNLTDPDVWILPILAGATTYLSSITMSANKNDQTQKMMTYFFPLMIFWWGRSFPAGLTLYWVVSNVFQAVQQIIITKPYAKAKEGSN